MKDDCSICFVVSAVMFGVLGFILGLLIPNVPLAIFSIIVALILIMTYAILMNNREVLSYAVIALGFFLGFTAIYAFKSLFGIGLLGLSVMVCFLIGNNIISKNKDYSKAEIRRSIALSIVAVFFALIAFGDKIEVKGILKDVMTNYWKIVMVVVGFYFGGRSVVEAILAVKESKKDDQNEKG